MELNRNTIRNSFFRAIYAIATYQIFS